ncbi:HEAT repeat domain-containing protein [Ktedonospora formicarum]|uniref:NACHT domain-containing protein n=1 Tax=Ktedonospora formicarum TaxID=2778364 RepID=A0A8J3I849_9CHLR|nr:HEAT repeat domain-containing protein [Ktedonospora formicarum]GHO49216.1 hypothetical protein KSX_73790 [Ktedonospora formicarum]
MHAPNLLMPFSLFMQIMEFQSFAWKESKSTHFLATFFPLFVVTTSPATAQPTPQNGQLLTLSSTDITTILVAIISLMGGIIVAVIAGLYGRYTMRHQKKIERLYEKEKQQEHNTEEQAQKLRQDMQRAQNIHMRAQTYRQAVRVDPYISRLQILDLSRPLEVSSIFIRVRVHQEARLRYKLDSTLLEAEAKRDPIALLEANINRIEARTHNAVQPDEAIRRYKHCVFVGDPGAGKTTLLKYLTLKAAEGSLPGLPDLPIYVELNAFVNSSHEHLLDFIASQWDERYGFPSMEARTYIETCLDEGKALLLLDALDEAMIGDDDTAAEATYRRVITAITNLAVRFRSSPFVVTTRKAGYQQKMPLRGFTELEIVEFGIEDIKLFIKNWFSHRQDQKQYQSSHDLLKKLESNARIQALATNPLLLSLITMVYEAQLDLPERRSELYKRCTEMLLTEWDAKRDIYRRREFKPEHKRQLLAEIAWHFHQQRRRYFPEQELLTIIGQFLPKIGLKISSQRRILAEIANENGLLKQFAHGWHGFMHLTFQEYFVVQFISDHQRADLILKHYTDPWWEEVLLLYAGYAPDSSSVLAELLGQSNATLIPEDIFHSKAITAGRCLAERPTIRQVVLREETINRLFDLLSTKTHTFTKERIAQVLVAIGGKEVNQRLLHIINEQSKKIVVAQSIAEAIGDSGDRSIIVEMMSILVDPQMPVLIRRSIAYALGKIGDSSIVPELLQLLADQRINALVRQSIAEALGKVGDSSIAPELLQLLADQRINAPVRQSIADILGGLGERSVIPRLLELLKVPSSSVIVQRSIAEALGRLDRAAVIEDFIKLLHDQSLGPSARQSIITTLGKLGERTAIPHLLQILDNDQELLIVRQYAAEALGRLGDRNVVPALWSAVAQQRGQKDITVLAGIINALAKLGEPSVLPALARMVESPQIDVFLRRIMIETLGDSEASSITSILLQILTNRKITPLVREDVAEMLGKIGDKTVVPQLLQILSSQQLDNGINRKIAGVIEQLADDVQTITILGELLYDSNVAEAIYRAMWFISRRAGVRLIHNGYTSMDAFDIVKW